jgi:hypothetical protein
MNNKLRFIRSLRSFPSLGIFVTQNFNGWKSVRVHSMNS